MNLGGGYEGNGEERKWEGGRERVIWNGVIFNWPTKQIRWDCRV